MPIVFCSPTLPPIVKEEASRFLDIYGLTEFLVSLHHGERTEDMEGVYADVIPNSNYLRADINFYDMEVLESPEVAGRIIEHEVVEIFLDYNLLSLVTSVLGGVDKSQMLNTIVQNQTERLVESIINVRRKNR